MPHGASGLDDHEWRECQSCLSGNHAACTALLKRHEPEIAKQMWRFTRDRTEHEELVQEVLVEVYLSLPRFRQQGVPLLHWLRCIATRAGYRFWKQQKRTRGRQSLEEIRAEAKGQGGEGTEAAAILHALLAEMPAPDRLVLTLMYFEECDMKEIGARAGWNIAMVKMRAYRARGRLKKMIEERNLMDVLMEVGDGRA